MDLSENEKNIFGLRVTFADYWLILNKIEDAIKSQTRLVIYYANFYTINLIKKDPQLKNIFNNAHVVHSDGIGIWLSERLINKSKVTKFNWTDNGINFLKVCEKKGWSIFFIGSTTEILNKAVRNVKENFPEINLVGYKNGFEQLTSSDLLKSINSVQPDILWVGMGTPKQEKWICENKRKLNCFVIQSVGDFFSFLAGEKKRGFKFIQVLGFEWLIRVLNNPKKYFKRYIIGIPKFVVLLLFKR